MAWPWGRLRHSSRLRFHNGGSLIEAGAGRNFYRAHATFRRVQRVVSTLVWLAEKGVAMFGRRHEPELLERTESSTSWLPMRRLTTHLDRGLSNLPLAPAIAYSAIKELATIASTQGVRRRRSTSCRECCLGVRRPQSGLESFAESGPGALFQGS